MDIDIILTEEENRSFTDAMAKEGYACIDAAFGNIKSEEAQATGKADLLAIRALVQSKPGGFDSLNSTVRQHLEQWFSEHGAVRSAVRHWVERKKSDTSAGGSGGSLQSERMSNSATLAKGSSLPKHPFSSYNSGSNQARQSPSKGEYEYADEDSIVMPQVNTTSIAVGSRCIVADRGPGEVRWVGKIGNNLKIGVALDEMNGLNDGKVRGTRYFECPDLHGVFCKPEKVTVTHGPPPASSGAAHGKAPRSAPVAPPRANAEAARAAAKSRGTLKVGADYRGNEYLTPVVATKNPITDDEYEMPVSASTKDAPSAVTTNPITDDEYEMPVTPRTKDDYLDIKPDENGEGEGFGFDI